jgi:hypothetical protein
MTLHRNLLSSPANTPGRSSRDMGLGVHALAVFGFSGGGPWGQDWEERKTREMIDKERGR